MSTKSQEIHNGLTFEQVIKQVTGSKFKIVNNFKKFTTNDFRYDDLLSEADFAILQAWRNWDPNKSKLNTHVTNYLNWHLLKVLDKRNPIFKANRNTRMNIINRGESLAVLKEKGITNNDQFNKKYSLDGKKPFTDELFRAYINFVAVLEFGNMFILNRNEIDDVDEYRVGDEDDFVKRELKLIPDESAENDLAEVEREFDLRSMPSSVQKVYSMVYAGHTLTESLAEAKITKHKLKKLQEELA